MSNNIEQAKKSIRLGDNAAFAPTASCSYLHAIALLLLDLVESGTITNNANIEATKTTED